MARVTLRDVAAASGVHLSTVSRVIRGDTTRIRPETVARVWKHAGSLGYRTDLWAASLRSGRTNIIGMLVPRITDVVLATVFESLEEEAARNDYLVLVASTWDASDKRRAALERFVARRVDGVVIADAQVSDSDVQEIADRGLPVLLVSRRTGELPFVNGDDRGGGAQAGEHLAQLGARDVVVIGGPDYASTSRDRAGGFVDAFRRAAPDGEVRVIPAGFDVESGSRVMQGLVEDGRPDGVFVVNDFAAIGAMSTMVNAGIRPGRDIAVVGYNDIPISSRLATPLSSVRADLPAMGRAAFHAIRQLIDGQAVESTFVATELVVRESSAAFVAPVAG
ncbi:LacI family DNA-binding transcriptional regulator [Homoserinibacter sp. GY 40078]|uniref:LacI family DNA-binding transcriptional regulator n=1 Tax=Homoserinibacter sp. GY 40078 TaxID=2603275 RepID=UPI0011C86BF5|nr:LacI family DNA-binding transcriptional regulator [Homoserinibacter sp. GY 40078]TXK18669.1 LacI family transcriptional regulator [Homoserinibacter sp. GY 40078]